MKYYFKMNTVLFPLFLIAIMVSCTKKSNPVSSGPVVNLNAKTYLEGTWQGMGPGASSHTWEYVFAGNSIVMKLDSITQDSGVFSSDTLANREIPDTMVIQIIKAANEQDNGKKIATIYNWSTSGSLSLLSIMINPAGAPRPDSINNDSLLRLSKGPLVNLNDTTYLQGIWQGPDPGANSYIWDYAFAGNSIVMLRDSIMQDSGVFSFDTSVQPNTMDILILKAANEQDNGKKISTIYTWSTGGSFTLLSIMMNPAGAPRPDSMNTDSLLNLNFYSIDASKKMGM